MPGAGDIATFDGTGNTPCTINTTASVAGVDINSGYTNTITQDAQLTVGTSNYDQADGTFTGGSQNIILNEHFVLSGGVFTATSGNMTVDNNWTHTAGGTFNHNNGTVVTIGDGATWNFDSGSTVNSGNF